MANLNAPKQGILNITLVQGNYLEVPTTWKNGLGQPIDLDDFDAIRMEVKKTYNVNETPFLTFTVGNGLTISGVNSNILTFVCDDVFWDSQTTKWVYDITFETALGEKYTYLKGTITVVLTASSL
jgi:hypothetical protein